MASQVTLLDLSDICVNQRNQSNHVLSISDNEPVNNKDEFHIYDSLTDGDDI